MVFFIVPPGIHKSGRSNEPYLNCDVQLRTHLLHE